MERGCQQSDRLVDAADLGQQRGGGVGLGGARTHSPQAEVSGAVGWPGKRVAPHSEVIRAIVLGDSPWCGVGVPC